MPTGASARACAPRGCRTAAGRTCRRQSCGRRSCQGGRASGSCTCGCGLAHVRSSSAWAADDAAKSAVKSGSKELSGELRSFPKGFAAFVLVRGLLLAPEDRSAPDVIAVLAPLQDSSDRTVCEQSIVSCIRGCKALHPAHGPASLKGASLLAVYCKPLKPAT